MNELYWCISILDRKRLPEALPLYEENHASVNVVTLGHGTATNETLDYLGLDETEKAVILTCVTRSVWVSLKKDLERRLRIDVPGTGIAFIIPVSSMGGQPALDFLTDGQSFEKGEVSEMKGTQRELLVVISNQGYNETVMDAARAAGAAGGTVIHARGTGMESAEKFFGVSLASEKDVILIVTATKDRNTIMESIMKNAGMDTRAKAIVFSLPISETAGLRLLDTD
ncbi:MAG: P-II family nitrogen regulator [Clostridia bacterium]|nr:P-II family nitrogen regulator [Clostridia bacterium]